jgi:hypothetical protein
MGSFLILNQYPRKYRLIAESLTTLKSPSVDRQVRWHRPDSTHYQRQIERAVLHQGEHVGDAAGVEIAET